MPLPCCPQITGFCGGSTGRSSHAPPPDFPFQDHEADEDDLALIREGAEDGIANGVHQGVGVGMTVQPFGVRNLHPAQHELAPGDELVNIIANANVNHERMISFLPPGNNGIISGNGGPDFNAKARRRRVAKVGMAGRWHDGI